MGGRPIPGVRVRETEAGVTYRLPGGAIPLAGLLLFAWAVATAAYQLWLKPLLFAVPPKDAGLAFLAAAAGGGLVLALARTHLTVGRGRLEWAWRVGPVPVGGGLRPSDRVRRLAVRDVAGLPELYRESWLGAHGSLLVAELDTGERWTIPCYLRRELLLAVADDLARRVAPLADAPVPVLDDPANREWVDPPAGCRLECRRTPEGLTLVAPPLGWGCLDCYFFAALVMTVFGAVATAVGVGTLAGVVPWDPAPPPWWATLAAVAGFVLVGLVGFLAAVDRLAGAFGRVEVRVEGDTLTLEESDWSGRRARSWDRASVRGVTARVDERANDRKVVLTFADGTTHEVLDHCTADEVRWAAAVLGGAMTPPPVAAA